MDRLPPCIQAAPIRPPVNAWEELLGIPKYHVSRFQTMAATIAASTTCWVAPVTSPLAMVSATLVKQRAPVKCREAAMIIGARGVRTRVETTVAIALAVS